jgi:hypothetical protein
MRIALVGLTVISLVGCRPVSQAALVPAVLIGVLADDDSESEETTANPVIVVTPPARCEPTTGMGCPPPPTVTCLTRGRFAAGSTTTLRASATGQDVRVRWSVARAPAPHGYSFATRPNGRRNSEIEPVAAEGNEIQFTGVIVGEYAIRAQAVDSFGRTAECESTLTMASHGLRVELSWDTAGTDVDLHMISEQSPRWFTDKDCYYAARQPDAREPDPLRRRWLDTDDVDGHGPENIRIDAPDPAQTYRIGVHYYSSHNHNQRTTPTVLVYCGETLRGRFSRPMTGTTDSMQNDFWEVASVRFDGNGDCSLAALNRSTTRSSIANQR